MIRWNSWLEYMGSHLRNASGCVSSMTMMMMMRRMTMFIIINIIVSMMVLT